MAVSEINLEHQNNFFLHNEEKESVVIKPCIFFSEICKRLLYIS